MVPSAHQRDRFARAKLRALRIVEAIEVRGDALRVGERRGHNSANVGAATSARPSGLRLGGRFASQVVVVMIRVNFAGIELVGVARLERSHDGPAFTTTTGVHGTTRNRAHPARWSWSSKVATAKGRSRWQASQPRILSRSAGSL